MAEDEGWLHCGRCGHMFRGALGARCPSCGGRPVVEEKELAFLRATRAAKDGATKSSGGTPRSGRKSGSRKTRSGLTLFVVGWVAFLGLVVGLVEMVRRGAGDGQAAGDSFTMGNEEQQRTGEAYRECNQRVTEFFHEGTPEGRARLVFQPQRTLRRMARSGGTEPLLKEGDKANWESFDAIDIAGQRAYEGTMKLDDGRRTEFVFLKGDDGEWRIDWANLVRDSDYPWFQFLAGDTPPSGEFRLLARRRTGELGGVGDVTSIVLYAPDPWKPGQLGRRSPEVQIAPGSRAAEMLARAFEDRAEGRGAFGSRLQSEDPPGMVRVRVKLRYHEPEVGEEPRIELEELVACHWMSVSGPGVGMDAD
jgi:DNA-directed RNA polymerase subunit RPC12/RpoP